MSNKILFIGLDVHKNSIDVAFAESGISEVCYYGQIGGEIKDLEKLVRKLQSKGKEWQKDLI